MVLADQDQQVLLVQILYLIHLPQLVAEEAGLLMILLCLVVAQEVLAEAPQEIAGLELEEQELQDKEVMVVLTVRLLPPILRVAEAVQVE